MSKPPEQVHEYVSFNDPDEDRTWVFDLTFLMSPWTCIFGRGCQGVLTEDATALNQGCCSYGAHFTDKADRKNVEKHAERLTDAQWQFAEIGRKKGISKKSEDGVHISRIVDGACIFLNRPGFAGGAGCALHNAASQAGESYITWKPEVCWQLPLHRDDHTDEAGHVTSTIREWKRRDWSEGGMEFHWWCTEAPEAFVGKATVWSSMEGELRTMAGDAVFELLSGYLRSRPKANVTFLPHPTVKTKAK
jgi:hypothetical protein